jgi:hypothetical protein
LLVRARERLVGVSQGLVDPALAIGPVLLVAVQRVGVEFGTAEVEGGELLQQGAEAAGLNGVMRFREPAMRVAAMIRCGDMLISGCGRPYRETNASCCGVAPYQECQSVVMR